MLEMLADFDSDFSMLRLRLWLSDAAILTLLIDLSFDTLPEREMDCDMDIETERECEVLLL